MPNKTYDKVQLRVKFTQAADRANIGNSDTNGENIAISFGKLSTWYEALVPTGGSSGKILAWNTAGTAKWSDPLHPTITKSADTTSTASPTHGGTFTTVDSVTRDANGHVTKINTKTVTLPADNDYRVKQENTTTSAEYRLLFSNSANDTTENAAISRKGTNLRYNPSTKSLYAGYYGSDPNITSRLTSLNFTNSGAGTGRTKVRFDLVTASLTTGAPPAESGKNSGGHVTTYSWDSNIDVMTQIYIPNGDHVGSSYGPQPLMIRGDDSGTWSDWRGIATFSQSSGSITSGQVVITDGTLGLVKTSGYTIAKSVPSNAVFTDTWTAMVGATSSANGSVGYVNAVPPKDGYNTKYLRADGTWAIPTNTDEKVKATKLAQSTAEAAYYPTLVSGAGTAGVSIFDSAKINHTPGTTSVVGNTRLILGNATASGTANNEEGLLKLYSPGTSYHTLKGASTSSIVEHTLPTTGGTILNDVTTSFTQSLTSGTKIGTIKINGTSTDLYCETNTNTDTKVTQTNTTTSADYRVLLSGNANDTTETTTGRKSANLKFNPSSGGLYSFGFLWTDITGSTLDINTLTLSNGTLHSRRFIEKTDGGAANITNIPVTGKPFLLEVDLIRWGSTTDYITRQRFTNAANGTYSYVRYCTNGTWGSWTTRKYTDTDTKVTSSANHYTPATASGGDISKSASGAAAAWSIDVVKGITLNTDGKGHVTGISVTSGKIPGNPNTDRYVNSAAFADDSTNTAASPVKMTLTRAGSDTATVTANIPKVSSSSAGVAPKGAAVSSQSQSTKFLREDGSWAAPSYTSIPSNNVTGSGTSGYLTKWNGTNTITNGPQLGSSTTTFLRNDGSWATPPGTYSHPTYTERSKDIYKFHVNTLGHVDDATALDKTDVSTLINKLDTGSSTPVDADYYISQYVGGGTTTTSYHRRPMSALWSYVKSKADSVYLPIGHTYPLSIAADSGTNALAMTVNTKYKLTAGGSTFIFTTPDGYSTTASRTANTVLAAPNGSNGTASFRKLVTADIPDLSGTYSVTTHKHGLLHSNLNQSASDVTTDAWATVGIDPTANGYVLKSIRYNTNVPPWGPPAYGVGIAFGGSDTKGIINIGYASPNITFVGGSHNSSKTAPTWYIKLTGTSGATYNLANFVTTDTKNTAGSTDTSSKIFLIGATSQAANPQTYSQDTAYVGTDGHVYSNSKQVVNLSDTQALTNKTYNGYTLAAACAKAVVTSIDTSASLPTSNAVKTFVEGKGYVTTDTKNTAGATDTSSKIFLIGATSQAANPQTYSDNEVYTTSGVLTTKKVQVGGGSCTMEYNSTTQSLDFIFT